MNTKYEYTALQQCRRGGRKLAGVVVCSLHASIAEKEHSEEDIDSLLGIDSSMSRGEKIDKLRNDFNKWNSRLNVVATQEEKSNAHEKDDMWIIKQYS